MASLNSIRSTLDNRNEVFVLPAEPKNYQMASLNSIRSTLDNLNKVFVLRETKVVASNLKVSIQSNVNKVFVLSQNNNYCKK